MNIYSRKIAFLLSVCFIGTSAGLLSAQVPSFPGAEGYGKFTTGGRGGAVYEVTNLNDSGAGSLRAAIQASGPRTVVFKVSGTIDLQSKLKISNPNITIAGQTAPGDGIVLKRYPLDISADNVIIRHIRARYGDQTGIADDAVSSRYTNNLMLDHISASWSLDEAMSIYHGQNVTIQWSMITEALDPNNHGFGGIWGSDPSSYHHNLIASNKSRNIRFASGAGNVDYRNNVVYNWSGNSAYGGEAQQVGAPDRNFINVNMVANYYKPGPATPSGEMSYRIVNPSSRNGAADYGDWYVADNYVVGNATVTADNWNGGVQPQGGNSFIPGLRLDDPWPAMPIAQQTAEDAYLSVLANAGASLPKRDSVDTRIVSEVTNGTFTYGNNGIITSQNQVGGWPTLSSIPAPADADHDGMPDDWELEHGLNPASAADRNGDFDVDGYTNLEDYLNDIGAFPATAPLVFNGGANNRYAQIENWSPEWQPSRFDTAVLPSGTVVVDAVGQHAGTIEVAPQSGQIAALNFSSGWLKVAGTVEIAAAGADGQVNLSGGKLRAGLLSKGAGGSFNFTGGVLVADVIEFDLINSGGTISPGDSPGVTHVLGDLTINSGALAIELGGTTAGTEFDQLLVNGNGTIGGTLNVSLVNGFMPTAGDTFEFLIAASIVGTLTPGTLPSLPGNLQWFINYDSSSVSLVSTFAGDFDLDGDVDGRDFLIWQRNPSIGNLGDWQTNYGSPEPVSTVTVPEPLQSVLLFSALVAMLGFRKPTMMFH